MAVSSTQETGHRPSAPPPRSGRRRLRWLALALTLGIVAAGVLLVTRPDAPEVPRSLQPPTGIPGRVTFDGDFRSGLEAWPGQIHPERVTVVDDPILGSERQVARFTVFDGDIGPTDNPRAQLEGPENLVSGGEYWVGWSTLFPEDFPAVPSDGWFVFQSVYGPPSTDSGPLATRIVGDRVRFERNETYGYDVAWETPLVRGKWLDFAYHIKLSPNEDEGFVELFLNSGDGWRRQLLFGEPRLYMRTLDATNGDGPNNLRMTHYRERGMFEEATLYHATPKVGTSFDAVAPKSYIR